MGRRELVGRVVVRPLVGHEEHVANALRTLDGRGELVEWPRQYRRLRDGRVAVNVRLLDRQAPARRHARARWVLIGAAAGTGVLAGGGYLAYLLTRTVMAHAAALLGFAVVVLLACWIAAGQAGACPGLHCPGCKCHR